MNKENTKWESSPSRSHIMEKEVHLWRAILDPTDGSAQPFKQMLSPAELRRANKFLTPETRNRFIITRGMLRFLLGRYLSVSPRRIEFQLGKQGKPTLPISINKLNIQFNLTHSHNVVLFAFTHSNPVGIDIEYEHRMAPYKKLVQRFFTREERKNLLKLSKDDLRKAFFQIWTAKEAVLKAMGTGLSFELDRLDTTKTLHQQTSEVVILNKDDTETRYIVYRIDPGSDYTAALAIINRDISIRYFQTPEHIRQSPRKYLHI